MQGEKENVQNNPVPEKVRGKMDTLEMFCVALLLAFPRRKRVGFFLSFFFFLVERRTKKGIFRQKKRITWRIKERNIRVLLSIP